MSRIAAQSGAAVPFQRPPELADDHTGTQPVIAHAITALELPDSALVCCLYPAAALITQQDLRVSCDLARESMGDPAVASIVPFSHPVARALSCSPDGRLAWQNPDAAPRRSQDLPALVHDAGQFYWANSARWRSRESLLDGALGYRLPVWRAVDIDTEEDWRHVELLASGLRAMGDPVNGADPPP